jgi:uncharacterized membrane protein YkoI
MKFALPLVFIFIFTFSIEAIAQGRFVPSGYKAQSKQHNTQKLKVKSNKQAARIAKSRFGGKVLKVSKKKEAYRVKLIKTNGQIISVTVNAKTGKVRGG